MPRLRLRHGTVHRLMDGLHYRGKILVRTIGTILLGTCVIMLVLGSTLLRDRLHGAQFLIYWSWCFLAAAVAAIVAMIDMTLIRRASRQGKHALLRDVFKK